MRISDWSSDVCSSDLKIATDSEHGWQLVRRDAKRRPRRIVKIHLVDVAVRYGIVAIAIPFGIPARDAEGQLIVDERNRSEERRVGKECVSKCRSRWSPYH